MLPQTGWTLFVRRLRTEKRSGRPRSRTVGSYQVYHDGRPASGAHLSGMTVEREGPGDNGYVGKAERRCIEPGTYPLGMHDTENYSIVDYESDGDNPKPAIGVRNTARRTGILVHPASGYGSTIGCFNLAAHLSDANSDIDLMDSTRRVIALIDDLEAYVGGQLPDIGVIEDSRLIVDAPPLDLIGRQITRNGSRGPFVRAWQGFLFQLGHLSDVPDGRFGDRTEAATVAFQRGNALVSDGKVGFRTISKARTLGFNLSTGDHSTGTGAMTDSFADSRDQAISDLAGTARRLEEQINRLAQALVPGGEAADNFSTDHELPAASGFDAAASMNLTSAQRLICERIINVFETGSIGGD